METGVDDTASGVDDTASGEIEPGSAHDEPTRNTRRRIERLPEGDLHEPMEENMRMQAEHVDQDVRTRRRLAEGDSNPVAAEHSFLLMPQSMPRGALFQKVVMPWILDPRD